MRLSRTTFLTILLTHLPSESNASTISSGFYAGFGAGMERLNGKRSEWLETDPAYYDSQTFTNNQQMKKNGHLANFFGGYLYRYKNFAVAGEAFYELGKVEDKIDRQWVDQPGALNNKGYFTAILEKKYAFGFKANLGGIFYQSTFAYILLGVNATQLRYNTTSTYIDINNVTNHYYYDAKRKLAYAFDYGLGLQRQIGQWRVGAEAYIRNISTQFLTNTFSNDLHPPPNLKARFSPSTIGLTLKAIFTF